MMLVWWWWWCAAPLACFPGNRKQEGSITENEQLLVYSCVVGRCSDYEQSRLLAPYTVHNTVSWLISVPLNRGQQQPRKRTSLNNLPLPAGRARNRSSRPKPSRQSYRQMARPPSSVALHGQVTGTVDACEAMASSSGLATWLLSVTERGTFNLLRLPVKHLLNPLHP